MLCSLFNIEHILQTPRQITAKKGDQLRQKSEQFKGKTA
jgi:hypothetical protein